MFTPEQATVHKPVASVSTETIYTSVGPNAMALQDSLPGSFPASQLDVLTLEVKNLQQEVELAELTCHQQDKECEVLRGRQVAFSPSEDSQLDALTLEAQHLKKEIHQAQLVHKQREKEREVLRLRQELSALQRDNSGAGRQCP